MKTDFMFTSESVTEGHPDKLCDQISDAIVDSFLVQDPLSRVIAECVVSSGVLFLAVRFASKATLDIPGIARRVVQEIAYPEQVFNARESTIMTSFQELPLDHQVSAHEDHMSEEEIDQLTVPNQATMFGFACNQTAAFMPLPIWLAHQLARRLSVVRLKNQLPYLSADGQTQVGVEYRNRRPDRIHSITVVATQKESGSPALNTLRNDLIQHVVEPVFQHESLSLDNKTKIWINPDGPVIGGGPALHAGLTGRKNAVDNYGGYSRHSGAALSGKDPTRIDRVGAYAARHAARTVVAAKLAEECEVQLSYTLGQTRPVSIQVETFGTGKIEDSEIQRRLEESFDFRLGGIIRKFRLRELPSIHKDGFYRKLATYGHFGRMDMILPWEQVDPQVLLD
ncbi:S-adenosylmethionine synthetase [Nitrosococcus halophilus Nc 4]|uniref:Methionine adenosyltransferase n=1 Tax=Nitrosococcus halophilus (strain Nc4) TaxID=472759 RepID=D5C0Z0_NITHN|nr:methionine adenosyltransferase [Nitrosococcus halophilus]ADE14547.1 S-adenosylmethionine synthetase [Nitrosococcus halophilus Nc 4]